MHALVAQLLDAAAEWGAGGKGGVDEREDDDRDAQGGGLGEDAEGIGVADALGPLVDGVVGGRGDDDGVDRAGPGLTGLAVLAAGRAAGQGLDGGNVKKVERGADQSITRAIDSRVQAEEANDDDDDGSAGVLAPVG